MSKSSKKPGSSKKLASSSTSRPKKLTWSEALARWEAALLAAGKAPSTARCYLLEARRLERHLARAGVDGPPSVTLGHLREYQVGLLTGAASASGRPNDKATVHRVAATLRGLFGFLAREGLLTDDPAARLELPRLAERVPGPTLDAGQVRRLLAAPDRSTPAGLRDRALLEVLYATGLRRGELLGLDLGDVDHRARELTVRRGKGGKGRVVPLIPTAWRHLAEYLDRGRQALASDHPDSGRALLLSVTGRRLRELALLRLLRRHAAAAGLGVRVTPHCLRRSFASELHERGASLRVIQELLGHASLDTTMVYLRADARRIRAEVLRHHPREAIDA